LLTSGSIVVKSKKAPCCVPRDCRGSDASEHFKVIQKNAEYELV
jgi:hypothetical protein